MNKSPDAFRTISEVAEDMDLPQHVLRFWETRFSQIKPMKRGGGRRYYRPDDIDLLRNIKALLYDEGYTIRGVQKLLKTHGNKLTLDMAKSANLEPADAGSGQSAVGVSDFVESSAPSASVGKKTKSILGKITGRGGADAADGVPVLGAAEVKNLQATLHELLECKRLLDQTRQE